MATDTPSPSAARPAPLLPTRWAQYSDNLLAAFRTAGAALLGNSALIYFGFVGAHPDKVYIALILGVVFIVGGCVPIAQLERDRWAKAEALRAQEDNGAKGA